MGDSENKKTAEDFDFESELSALVQKNAIPSRIAERISEKLKEKNVQLTRKQLYLLVDKINEIMSNYKKFDNKDRKELKQPNKVDLSTQKPSANMQKLVESIDKLEERLNKIEKEKPKWDETTSKTKVVTTDDIKVDDKIEKTTTDFQLNPLTKIPNNPESVIVLMKWLQYLIDKCGRENLSNILDYYVDIGWITENTKISLLDYSNGITRENKEQDTTKNISDLPSKDHIQSLIFIQKLKGNSFDKHFIERIDSEISRMTKKIDNYNIK